jgi:hypothetical protein
MSEINQELFKQIRDNFEKALQEKTGWGRNDIMNVFNRVAAETTMAFVGGSGGDDEESDEEEEPLTGPAKSKLKKPVKKKVIADEDDSIDAAQEEDGDMHKASVKPPKKQSKPHPLEGMDRRDIRKGIVPQHMLKKGNDQEPPWD